MKKINLLAVIFLTVVSMLFSCETNGDSFTISEYDIFVHSSVCLASSDTQEDETSSEASVLEFEASGAEKVEYILNKNSKKFHFPDCRSVKLMKEKNKEYYFGERATVIKMGFSPCKHCMP